MYEQQSLLTAIWTRSLTPSGHNDAQPQEQAQKAPAVKYYPIDEETARRAHEMMSMRDYPAGRATNEYRASVDKAAALVERCKAATSPYYHGKLDALLDRYARRLAQWTNDYNRNGASCPSILVSGGSNFPVKKKQAPERPRGQACGRSIQKRSRPSCTKSKPSAPAHRSGRPSRP